MNETRREINERNRRIYQAAEWAERHRLPNNWQQRLELHRGITVSEILDQLDNMKGKP